VAAVTALDGSSSVNTLLKLTLPGSR